MRTIVIVFLCSVIAAVSVNEKHKAPDRKCGAPYSRDGRDSCGYMPHDMQVMQSRRWWMMQAGATTCVDGDRRVSCGGSRFQPPRPVQ